MWRDEQPDVCLAIASQSCWAHKVLRVKVSYCNLKCTTMLAPTCLRQLYLMRPRCSPVFICYLSQHGRLTSKWNCSISKPNHDIIGKYRDVNRDILRFHIGRYLSLTEDEQELGRRTSTISRCASFQLLCFRLLYKTKSLPEKEQPKATVKT